MIFIPPFSSGSPDPSTPLPPCLQDHPTAIIHYRWQGRRQGHKLNEQPEVPPHWPTPTHDITFAYSWLSANLGATSTGTGTKTCRSAYIVGSYLGASLAASLALTESHFRNRRRPMNVLGLVAYNGIYNWTTFLPDHPIHWNLPPEIFLRNKIDIEDFIRAIRNAPSKVSEEAGIFTELKHRMPALFSAPGNLFDPFASPCLFFHMPGLFVPDDFVTRLTSYVALTKEEVNELKLCIAIINGEIYTDPKATRDEILAQNTIISKLMNMRKQDLMDFPSDDSGLRPPNTLLLHDRPLGPEKQEAEDEPSEKTIHNDFRLQATALARLMRRSLTTVQYWPWEAEKMVRLCEVEPAATLAVEEETGLGLGEEDNDIVRQWLREKMDEEEEYKEVSKEVYKAIKERKMEEERARKEAMRREMEKIDSYL